MDWNNLTSKEQLDLIDAESAQQAVLIYKHSTRCSICSTVFDRIERKWDAGDSGKLKPYYLDLLKFPEVSQAITERYGVVHESPQVLVIRKGKCVLFQNHMDIRYDDLMAAA